MTEEEKYLDAFRTTLPVLIDKEMYKVRRQQRSLVMLVCVLLGVNMLLFGAGLFLLLYNRQQPVMVQPVMVPSAGTAPVENNMVVEVEPEVAEEPATVVKAKPKPAPKPAPRREPAEAPQVRRVEPAPKRVAAQEPVAREARRTESIPDYVLTRSGTTLQELAVRYYGHALYWVCIYDYNTRVLKDPDVLPLGIRLHLPRPEEYGIDASDPASLRRARAMARSLE